MAAVGTPSLDRNFVARDFHLKSVDGSLYNLKSFEGCSALLIMFICNHCPYVKAIIGRLVTDTRELMDNFKVGVVGIMPNDTSAYPEDSYGNMIGFAAEHDMRFPYLIDETQSTARDYGAVCTPDFFCFNRQLQLRYRGRFDATRESVSSDTRSELFEAVKMVSSSGEGPDIQKPSIGCSIKWRCVGNVQD